MDPPHNHPTMYEYRARRVARAYLSEHLRWTHEPPKDAMEGTGKLILHKWWSRRSSWRYEACQFVRSLTPRLRDEEEHLYCLVTIAEPEDSGPIRVEEGECK